MPHPSRFPCAHLPRSSIPSRRAPRLARRVSLAGACLFLLFFVSAAHAQKAPSDSSNLHSRTNAKTILLLADFVDWSSTLSGPGRSQFGVCVIGKDPFGAQLDSLVLGQLIGGRKPFLVRTMRPEEIQGCSILFISPSEQEHLLKILAAADAESCLTISDMDGFVQRGGMVELLPAHKGPHFLINLAAVGRARLKISSRLLAISWVWPPQTPSGND
ncbi:MAG: YfiR family protein [Candidatus Acidiferrales bacterium]